MNIWDSQTIDNEVASEHKILHREITCNSDKTYTTTATFYYFVKKILTL
jgi:hypothetical protein